MLVRVQPSEWLYAYLTRFSFEAVYCRLLHHTGNSCMASQRLQNCIVLSSAGNSGMPRRTLDLIAAFVV
jgi:hypothetical protein